MVSRPDCKKPAEALHSHVWRLAFSMPSLIMGHLGSDVTAASSIASVAQELITCICKGISAGTGIMIGKLLGQSLFEKARGYGRKFCHISFWTCGIHMALLGVVSPIVARFFVLSETARRYLIIMPVFTAVYVFAYSVNTVIVCGSFPTGGDAGYDTVSVLLASWCFTYLWLNKLTRKRQDTVPEKSQPDSSASLE